MCIAAPVIAAIVAVVGTAASVAVQNENSRAQAKVINAQNQLQADQLNKQAGQEMTEEAQAARRERAAMRVNAAESGINLGSGSFIAAMQTSAMTQYNNAGLITQNEKGQQDARQLEARGRIGSLPFDNAFSAALKIGTAGAGAYQGARNAAQRGSDAAVAHNT